MKKRFITISIYGYATDHGFMEESEIFDIVRKEIKDIEDNGQCLDVTRNDLGDLFILSFNRRKDKVILMI